MGISKKIAQLRKDNNMTQEELADIIGVTSQAVSKWENDVSMPDISLLPIIADIFKITIDELFDKASTDIKELNPDNALNKVCEEFLKTMQLSFGNFENNINHFNECLNVYKKSLIDDERMQTAIIKNHGVLYYKNTVGGLILKRPKNGWSSLFCNNTFKMLSIFSDKDVFKLIKTVVENNIKNFTFSSICKLCEIEQNKQLEEKIITIDLFMSKEVLVDNNSITIYELQNSQKLFMIFAILTYANEYIKYQDIYINYTAQSDFYAN